MKDNILKTISNASLEQILDINDLNDVEWIWVNQGIFLDLLLNLKIDESLGESAIDKFIRSVTDNEVINSLDKPFRSMGYLPMNQFLFSMAEKGFNPTKDIETTIFVKEKLYKKLTIKLTNEFSWILKAMAIDTFFKMGTQFKSLTELYTELFEDNSRIIETVLSNQEHTYLTGRWKFERKTKELLFLKSEEIFQSWGEGEAEARFREASR